jgi:hypothetical protein
MATWAAGDRITADKLNLTQFAFARYALISTDLNVTLPGGDTQMKFPTTITADSRVVPSQDFKSFTLAAGLWTITMAYRLTVSVDNTAYLMVGTAGSNEDAAFAAGPTVRSFQNGLVADVVKFTSPTVVAPYIWTGAASAATKQGLDTYGVTHISFKGSI